MISILENEIENSINTIRRIQDIIISNNYDMYITEAVETKSTNNIIKRFGSCAKSLLSDIDSFVIAVDKISGIKINKKKFEDAIVILNLMRPNTLHGSLEILKYFIDNASSDTNLTKNISIFLFGRQLSDSPKYEYKTTLLFEIIKTIKDLQDCKKACSKSSCYKRFFKNSYTTADDIVVDASNIILEYQESKEFLNDYVKLNSKISKIIDNKKNQSKNFITISSKIITLLDLILKYYSDRLNILNTLLSKATDDDIVINKDEYKIKVDISNKLIETKEIQLSMNETKHLFGILEKMVDLDNKKKFAEYKKLYKIAAKTLGISPKYSFTINSNTIKISNNTARFSLIYLAENYRRIDIKNKTLYHTSSFPNLDKIKPCCYSKDIQLFTPSPRIYFHISFPLDKYGREVNKNINDLKQRFKGEDFDDFKLYVYEIENNLTYAYIDSDLGYTAAFIETDKPIKIKKSIDLDTYYNT